MNKDKWEYIEKETINTDIGDLNRLGSDGWEMCGTISREHGNSSIYLKRKK